MAHTNLPRPLGEQIQSIIDGLPFNRRHMLVFALCGAGLFFESLNLQLMSFVAPVVAQQWHIAPRLLGATLSAAMVGMIVGTYLFGSIADRLGRKFAFQLTVGIFSGLTALSGASVFLWQLIVARFAAGVGIGGSIPVETAVLAEFTPLRLRARLMAVWAMALPLGAFVAPLCVALMPAALGWRGLLFMGGAPAALIVVLRRTIPETPQYLASRQRVTEAKQSLEWMVGQPVALLPDTPRSIQLPASRRPEALLFDQEHRRLTVMSWTIYFGSFFGYYGFVLWLPTLLGTYRGFDRPHVLHFMLGLAVAGLLGRIAIMVVGDWLSRRAVIVLCAAGALVSVVGFGFQTIYLEMLSWAYIAAFLLEGIFSVVIPFVADLYPPEARASGVGWAGGMGRIGTALAPLGVGMLVQSDVRFAIWLLGLGPLLVLIACALGKANADSSTSVPTDG